MFSGTGVVLTTKKGAKKTSNTLHFNLVPCSFCTFVLLYQGCNIITLNPSKSHNNLDVILMKQYNFGKLLSCNLSNQNENCFIYSNYNRCTRFFVGLIERDAKENGRGKTKQSESCEEIV